MTPSLTFAPPKVHQSFASFLTPSPSASSWPELGTSLQLSAAQFSSSQASASSAQPSASPSSPQCEPGPAKPGLVQVMGGMLGIYLQAQKPQGLESDLRREAMWWQTGTQQSGLHISSSSCSSIHGDPPPDAGTATVRSRFRLRIKLVHMMRNPY